MINRKIIPLMLRNILGQWVKCEAIGLVSKEVSCKQFLADNS